MPECRTIRNWPLAVLLGALAGCGGGGVSTGGGSSSGALGEAVATVTAPVKVLDLSTGRITDQAGFDASLPAYRDGQMAFRAVGSGAGRFFIGVFEVTQAQWVRLAGSTPWTAVVPGEVPAGSVAGGMPAFNLSYNAVTAALAAFQTARSVTLAVPSNAQWTEACGGATTWSWGSSAGSPVVLATRAVVREGQGVTGPRAVGGTSANANGLFDLHGNVWEWTSPGVHIRGGSWFDPVYTARTANLAGDDPISGIDASVAHALVGVRLVLLP